MRPDPMAPSNMLPVSLHALYPVTGRLLRDAEQAIENSDHDLLYDMLAKGAPTGTPMMLYQRDETLFHVAVDADDSDAVDLLAKYGRSGTADGFTDVRPIDAVDMELEPPVARAANQGRAKAFRALVRNGADLGLLDRSGRPLQAGAVLGMLNVNMDANRRAACSEILAILRNHGMVPADGDFPDEFPVATAIRNRFDYGTILDLIRKGHAAPARTRDGRSTLAVAVQEHPEETVFLLVEEGGLTCDDAPEVALALCRRALSGKSDHGLLDYLVKHAGLDVNDSREGFVNLANALLGESVRHFARDIDAASFSRLLGESLDLGMDLSRTRSGGPALRITGNMTPFEAMSLPFRQFSAVENDLGGTARAILDSVLDALESNGVDLAAQTDANGDTLLHVAADIQSGLMVDVLLKRGCRDDVTDADGRTPSQRARHKATARKIARA